MNRKELPSRGAVCALVLSLCSLTAVSCISLRPWNEATRDLAPGRLVEADEHPVSVEQAGAGDPLVLLHGFGGSTFMWRKVMAPLAERHRVIAIDMNGFGYTQRPRDPAHYTLAGQEREVLGVMDRLGVGSATLMGHSYGGAVSLYIASRHPERVARLVLVDNAMPLYAFEQRSGLFRWRWLAKLLVHTTGIADRRVRKGLLESYFNDALVTPELLRDYTSRLRIEGAADAYRGLLGPSEEPPVNLDLKTIMQPTLAVWGAEDELIPMEAARQRSADLPHGRFVALPACGHSPMEECPESFLAATAPFLDAGR